ncbi:hypothetical protein PQI23_02400 [Leucobacter sp. USCH14]|uniref:hypothetical protein n=1 Tax=Leucobacter sp. USCH14 TaxID=3024838 RepID=UPI0030ACB287
MVERSNLIQVASDEWIVMREFAQYPKAVIRGIRDTSGDARYLLLAWHPVRHRQRMVGIFTTREEAENAVPWPSRSPRLPGLPGTNGSRSAIRESR